jgi:hypothetical protein
VFLFLPTKGSQYSQTPTVFQGVVHEVNGPPAGPLDDFFANTSVTAESAFHQSFV